MMTPDMMAKLRRSLVEHEDKRNFPYVDTEGKITIGIGYNLTDRGLPDSWVNSQFQDDVTYFFGQLSQFPWFTRLNEDRQICLVDMCFMGLKKFFGFTKMLDALDRDDYSAASFEMLNSDWAKEVKGRAAQLAKGILTGVYSI